MNAVNLLRDEDAERHRGCRSATWRSSTRKVSGGAVLSRARWSSLGRGLAICASLFVLSTNWVCAADAGPSGRTPDDSLDLPPSHMTDDRLGDTKKQLEHWSQMTKDHLEIPTDRNMELGASEIDSPQIENEEIRRPMHDTAPNDQESSATEKMHIISDAKDPPPSHSPKAGSELPLVPSHPMSDTTSETVPRRRAKVGGQDKFLGIQGEIGALSNSDVDSGKGESQEHPQSEVLRAASEENREAEANLEGNAEAEAEAEAENDELEPKAVESHARDVNREDLSVADGQSQTTDDDVGDDTSVDKESIAVSGDDADLSSTEKVKAEEGPEALSSVQKPEETTEEQGRRNHRRMLQDEAQQSKRAEENLIKDAVTHGNRAKSSEGDSDITLEDSKPETALETEIREIMKHAERFRWGIKDLKPDYSRAFSLCENAAEKGSLDGINCLGEFFKHGLGRERDIEKAVKHFRDAANRGHAAAQRNLAFLYSSGHGVEQSTAQAVLHLHFAAVSGDHQAQLAMGYRHMYGIGVPKNCQTAMEFYMPASEFVVKELHNNRAQPMIEKQALSSEGTKTKNLDLDEDVVNYYAYSADRGDASAQVALGQLYFMGARGLQQDHGEAFKWYVRAADQGDANAMGHLGNMYAQGIHVEGNNQTALSYFRRGVEKGNALALNGLGFMHMYGMGVPQSYDEAFKSFSKAAEQGNQEARFNLGALHVGGYGVPKDYAKAIYYFTLAANRGHMLALYNLAMMHHNGFGTPRSCPNAVQFIKSVAERGEWAAQLQRGYKLYMSGDVDRSLLVYSEVMELGFDVAQANVAHILDEERSAFTRGQKGRALRAYELSAQQGNMAAELKIGDYYYHGWGAAVNYRKAVAHYRAASEARIAQAMFNLGWMHEQGNGIARDRHLAKRFYDMAAEAAPEAVWPAGICLAKLWLVGAGEAALERVDAAALALTLRLGRYGLRVPMSAVWVPLAIQYWDAILGSVLVTLLVAVLAVRSQLAVARPTRRN